MMDPQAAKEPACPAHAAQSLKVFDLTLPARYVDMRFRRIELLHVGCHHIKCPAAEVSSTRGQAGHVNRKRPEEGP